MEITRELHLTDKQRAQVELHTFLKMLNILLGEFERLRKDIGLPDAFPESTSTIKWILAEVREGDLNEKHALKLASIGFYFSRELHESLEENPQSKGDQDLQQSAGNIFSIVNVLVVRLQEYFDRRETGDRWETHSIPRLDDNFRKLFAAIEKNGRGRYHILFDATDRGANDYLVNLQFGHNGDKEVRMPAVMQDVFRDLVANARKYTPPGGEITASLCNHDNKLRLAIQDNGNGIPKAELDKVVEFGYRAGNVRENKTKGGGFGLTKAYTITRQLGGRMWIDSAKEHGTKITIHIPCPKPKNGE